MFELRSRSHSAYYGFFWVSEANIILVGMHVMVFRVQYGAEHGVCGHTKVLCGEHDTRTWRLRLWEAMGRGVLDSLRAGDCISDLAASSDFPLQFYLL